MRDTIQQYIGTAGEIIVDKAVDHLQAIFPESKSMLIRTISQAIEECEMPDFPPDGELDFN